MRTRPFVAITLWISTFALLACALATSASGPASATIDAPGTPSSPATTAGLSQGPLGISYPTDRASVSTAQVVVSGTGPAGATVVRDISFAPDDHTVIDAQGAWSMPVDLNEGPNSLTFRLGDDKATAIMMTVYYTPAALTPDPSLVAALGKDLIDNFGSPGYETPWWHHIKSWNIEDGGVVITTDLTAHDAEARNICSAASNYGFEEGSGVKWGAVEIRALDGSVIWKRSAVSDPC
jgi:hypothetical protein